MNLPSLLILDTHVWIWWIEQDALLSHKLRDFIEEYGGEVAVSAATVYEMVILVRRGRIQINREVDDWIERATRGMDIEILPVNGSIAKQAGQLAYSTPFSHPFHGHLAT